jgi:hypothetical protein
MGARSRGMAMTSRFDEMANLKLSAIMLRLIGHLRDNKDIIADHAMRQSLGSLEFEEALDYFMPLDKRDNLRRRR